MTPTPIYSTAALPTGVLHIILTLALACALCGFLLAEGSLLERFFIRIGLGRSS